MTNSFLRGFATATGMSQQESSEQWAGFSRMLSDSQIRKIERGGYASGVREGKRFRKLYSEEEENPVGASAIPKGIWTVRTWQGDIGQFSTRKAAQQYCTRRREADRQAGNKVDARVVRVNPTRAAGPSAIPTKWTPATVSRKGGQIQIRMGGR